MSSDSMNSYDSSVSSNSLDTTTPANSNNYKVSEYFPCAHSKVIRHKNRSNCFTCGIFLHDTAKSYKSPKMKYGAYFDPSRFYSSTIKTRQPKIVISSDSEFYKCRNGLLDLVWETSAKLQISQNTMHLAVMFMDLVLNKLQNIPSNLFKVYAVTSLMLAAKTIELDERIPFISKLQTYSGLISFKPKDFAAAEIVILKELSWNLQCVTVIDILEYFLSQGIVFSTDQIIQESTFLENNALKEKVNFIERTRSYNTHSLHNPSVHCNINNPSQNEKENQNESSQKPNFSNNSSHKNTTFISLSALTDSKINSIVAKIETDYLKLANLITRDPRMRQYDLKTLSAASVCFLRSVNGLSPLWTEELSTLTNKQITQKTTQVQDCLAVLNALYSSVFNQNMNSTIHRGMLRDGENNQNVRQVTPNKLPQQQILRSNTYSTSASCVAKTMTSDSIGVGGSIAVASVSAFKQYPVRQAEYTSQFSSKQGKNNENVNETINNNVISNTNPNTTNSNNNSSFLNYKSAYSNYQLNTTYAISKHNYGQNQNRGLNQNHYNNNNNIAGDVRTTGQQYQQQVFPVNKFLRFGSTIV